jgi:hypothetical protein
LEHLPLLRNADFNYLPGLAVQFGLGCHHKDTAVHLPTKNTLQNLLMSPGLHGSFPRDGFYRQMKLPLGWARIENEICRERLTGFWGNNLLSRRYGDRSGNDVPYQNLEESRGCLSPNCMNLVRGKNTISCCVGASYNIVLTRVSESGTEGLQ